jgi:hypothetical protein
MTSDLERRYRRVLRLLPGWYREQWEQDMVAAFLDSWLTGDPAADEYISQAAGPGASEVTSVARLAVRLRLSGPGTPRRYAWNQAVRRAVLAVLLVHAVLGTDILAFLLWSRRLVGWLPTPPGGLPPVAADDAWAAVYYLVSGAWIVIFVALALGRHRTARVLAALALVPGLAALVQAHLTGIMPAPFGPWAFWVLIDLVPVLAMTGFRRDTAPVAPQPWLLALPAGYLLVYGPLLALQETGNSAWLPDFSGLCCILLTLACVAHAPVAWSRHAGTGLWSLTLVLLAAVAGAYRVVSLTDYLNDPHLVNVSLAELLIMLAAVALVAPDAARAQAARPAPPPSPHATAA